MSTKIPKIPNSTDRKDVPLNPFHKDLVEHLNPLIKERRRLIEELETIDPNNIELISSLESQISEISKRIREEIKILKTDRLEEWGRAKIEVRDERIKASEAIDKIIKYIDYYNLIKSDITSLEPKYHLELALKILYAGKGRYVFNIFNLLTGILNNKDALLEFAKKYIRFSSNSSNSSHPHDIMWYYEYFTDLDDEFSQTQIINEYIDNGYSNSILFFHVLFDKLSLEKIRDLIISKGKIDEVDSLFPEISSQLFIAECIKYYNYDDYNFFASLFLKNFNSYTEIQKDTLYIAKEFILNGNGNNVIRFFENLERNLSEEDQLLLFHLLDDESISCFLEHFTKFKKLQSSELQLKIALELIERGHTEKLYTNLHKFTSLKDSDKELINSKICQDGYFYLLGSYTDNQDQKTQITYALACIERGRVLKFFKHFYNLGKINDYDSQLELVQELVKSDIYLLCNFYPLLDKVPKEVILKYIESEGRYSEDSLDQLKNSKRIIENNFPIDALNIILMNFKKFSELQNGDAQLEFIIKLIEKDNVELFLSFQNNFDECFKNPAYTERIGELICELGYMHLIFTNKNFEIFFDKKTTEEKREYFDLCIYQKHITTEKFQVFNEYRAVFGFDSSLRFIIQFFDNFKIEDLRTILRILNQYNIELEQFISKILNQVDMDNTEYQNSINSYKYLVRILEILENQTLFTDFSKYKEIIPLEISKKFEMFLTNDATDPIKVFSSWLNLRLFYDSLQLLFVENRETLNRLKNEKNLKLKNYVLSLLSESKSYIDISKILLFYLNFSEFLDLRASYTKDEITTAKKPSIPLFFKLSEDDIRDALLDGDIDAISRFRPLTITYKICRRFLGQSLHEITVLALGKKNGSESLAKNPKSLFNKLLLLFGSRDAFTKYLETGEISNPEIVPQLRKYLFDRNIGIQLKESEFSEIRVRIILKSDPKSAITGNQIGNCMPFGDGKNTNFIFNPATMNMVVEIKSNKEYRTIASSVLTLDCSLGKDFSENIFYVDPVEMTSQISQIDLSVLSDITRYITCDSIEIAKNYSQYKKLILNIYQDFLQQYVSSIPNSSRLVGFSIMGYDEEIADFKRLDVTTVPVVPIPYSDRFGRSLVFQMDQELKDGYIVSRIEETIPETVVSENLDDRSPGTHSLTYEHTLAVSWIESKAYTNQSLISGFRTIGNTLIMKDIYNKRNGKPNMSFIYRDNKGDITSYLICYEGVKDGEPILYINDLASINLVGTFKIIQEFIRQYKENYYDKNNKIPIFCYARESTSYRIIQKSLIPLLQRNGIKVQTITTEMHQSGNENMHHVYIRPL